MEREKTKRGFLAHIHTPHVSVYSLKFKATLGLGTLLIATFAVLLGSGVLLTSAYEPDFYSAYESTWEISNVYPYGGFVRSLHHLGGNLFVVASVLHLLRILWSGAYVGSRYRNYLYGLALFAGVFLELATEYFLPMSEVSYWALVVGMSFLDYLPFLGGVIKRLVMGGQEIGNTAIIRLYVLHIAILPLFLVGMISLHLWRIKKDQGLLKPETIGEEELKKVPLAYATTREWTVVLVTVLALVLCAMAFPVAMVPRAMASASLDPLHPPGGTALDTALGAGELEPSDRASYGGERRTNGLPVQAIHATGAGTGRRVRLQGLFLLAAEPLLFDP